MVRSRNGTTTLRITDLFVVLILTAFIVNLLILFVLHSKKDDNDEVFFKGAAADTRDKPSKVREPEQDASMHPMHQLAGLKCDAYGGPSEDIASEMVYWQDIPSDDKFVSPFKRKGEVQYLTFEPDIAGWNNVRTALETAMALAYAMGRTLVLPPSQRFDKINNDDGGKAFFSFSNFFHIESISNEHEGLKIITMKEFLEQHAMAGKMQDQKTGMISFPPNNRTDWDRENKEILKTQLTGWLRNVTHVTIWDAEQCMAAFPATTDPKAFDRLNRIKEDLYDRGGYKSFYEFVGHPTPVDAPLENRMKEVWADRKSLCVYDKNMQNAPVVHFPSEFELGARLMVHFYALVFFEDWRQDLWMKRFVRDHVRYTDEIQCAAARVVHAVRDRAKSQNKNNKDGLFDSFHIRRGDFQRQFKDTGYAADVIYNVSKDELTEGGTVFVATDERNKDFFQPLADHYDLVYLDDFAHLLKGVNINYYGMLDQLVASRGRIFFGCYASTFTSYINRVRGYHVDKNRLPGYENGTIPSYYYATKDRKYDMQVFYPVKQTFWAREFPSSWWRLNKGIIDE